MRMSAPAWKLVTPEPKTVEDEWGEEKAEPFQLRRGKDMEVLVSAENCEGLYGRGEGQLLISKRVYANILFVNEYVTGMGRGGRDV